MRHQQMMTPVTRDTQRDGVQSAQRQLAFLEDLSRQSEISEQNRFDPVTADLNNQKLLHDRYLGFRSDSHMKERKSFERTLSSGPAFLSAKAHERRSSLGSRRLRSSADTFGETRFQESALTNQKMEFLYSDTNAGVANNSEIIGPGSLQNQAQYSSLVDEVFGLANYRAAHSATTLGYSLEDARVPPATLPLPNSIMPNLAASGSLKMMDPLTLSRVLLDQQVVAMAQMQQLKILQQSYLSSGGPFCLLPENLTPSDIEMLWQLKHGGYPLSPTWLLPSFHDETCVGLYQDQLKAEKHCKTELRGLQEEIEEFTRYLQGMPDALQMGRTANSFPLNDKKNREKKTFLEKDRQQQQQQQQGSVADGENRERRWSYAEPGLSDAVSWHQQNRLRSCEDDGPLERTQAHFRQPEPYHQQERKSETCRQDEGSATKHCKIDWPEKRGSLRQEFTRKFQNQRHSTTLQVSSVEPEKDQDLKNSSRLKASDSAYGLYEHGGNHSTLSKRLKDGHLSDWSLVSGHAKNHTGKPNHLPGNVFGDRCYNYSHECRSKEPQNDVPSNASNGVTDLHLGKIDPNMIEIGNISKRYSFQREDSRQWRNSFSGFNGLTALPPYATNELYYFQGSHPGQLVTVESPMVRSSENLKICIDREMNNNPRKRLTSKPPDDVASGFQSSLYPRAAAISTRYSHFQENASASLVYQSLVSPCVTRLHNTSLPVISSSVAEMPSLSLISRQDQDLLQNRRSERIVGTNVKAPKRLKLDIPPSADSPLPSWMNMSTFSSSSTNCIDSFKSFVDHTVQNAFINEMKETESSLILENKTKLKIKKVSEDLSRTHSSSLATCSRRSSTEFSLADSAIPTVSLVSSLLLHPLSASAETSQSLSSSPPDSVLIATETVNCVSEPSGSSVLDSSPSVVSDGLISQMNESGVHTKFKKTWLLSYLDQGRQPSSYSSCGLQTSDGELEKTSCKDTEDAAECLRYDKDEDRRQLNENNCSGTSPVETEDCNITAEGDLSVVIKLDPAGLPTGVNSWEKSE